jgi:flagellar motor switch protein FliG
MTAEAPAKLPALPSSPEELTGAQRAAILLIALGVETAGFVLPLLPDAAVERISVEVARFRNVPGDLVDDVLLRFRQESGEPNPLAQGGKAVAREMLLNALGADRTEQVMNKVTAATELSAFQLLQTVEPAQVAKFLHGEHPQTAALILGRVAPNRASRIVAALDEEFRAEVLYRLGTMGEPSPDLLTEVEAVIFEELGPSFGGGVTLGGAERVAAILNNSGRSVGAALMETLRERSPELAGSVKGFMFVFDDLLHVAGRDLQRILTEVDQRDLALALKGASDELKDKVLENVSERVRASIVEEIELMGPVRVSDVEEAQQRVVEAAQTLDEAGEIELTSPTAAAEAMLA